MACGHQSGQYSGSDTEFLQCGQLPHCVAQNSAWETQALQEVDEGPQGEHCFTHLPNLTKIS